MAGRNALGRVRVFASVSVLSFVRDGNMAEGAGIKTLRVNRRPTCCTRFPQPQVRSASPLKSRNQVKQVESRW
jgi:hypothetical protein